MSDQYIVYFCYSGVELLYIGHGKVGRHTHCNSGVSHVYELNKWHFTADTSMTTEIYQYFPTKQLAKECEEDLIRKCLPEFNTSVAKAEKRISQQFGWLDNAHKVKNSLDIIIGMKHNITHSNNAYNEDVK